MIVESRGEIRVRFPDDEYYLTGHQAVDKAIKLNYNDKDLAKLDWDMNNWFAIIIYNMETKEYSDDLALAHCYEESVDVLLEVYNSL